MTSFGGEGAPAGPSNEAGGRTQEMARQAFHEVGKVIYGQEQACRLCLAALLSSGHVLLEGVPGTAKTMLVRTIAETLDMTFSRIQFTPDLLPNDITGAYVFRSGTGDFEFRAGPVFANFVLADEINRAPAKTQAALLESMQEGTVTQEKTAHPLPEPFVVFATQNPVEHEGTYPLPVAQLDRFMFKIIVDYPPAEAEERIYARHHATHDRDYLAPFQVAKTADPEAITEARQVIRDTYVREEVVRYVRMLVAATREDANFMVGASPRAGLMMLMGAKSIARFQDRDFVTPDDVKVVLLPALRHRVVLSPSSELEGVTVDEALTQMGNRVEVPR